jgi:hypothetical protein
MMELLRRAIIIEDASMRVKGQKRDADQALRGLRGAVLLLVFAVGNASSGQRV